MCQAHPGDGGAEGAVLNLNRLNVHELFVPLEPELSAPCGRFGIRVLNAIKNSIGRLVQGRCSSRASPSRSHLERIDDGQSVDPLAVLEILTHSAAPTA